MSHTARTIFAEAALGSLVGFSDGMPRPLNRFRRKLCAWEDRNGQGRIVARAPAWREGGPDSFTLHLGDYGFQGVTVINRTYQMRQRCIDPSL